MESFFVYDTTADNWTQLTSPNAIIMNPILFCWDGLLFAVGDGGLNRYDPDKDTWTHVSELLLLPENIPGAIFEPFFAG